jgi:dephospho-CoA kinase
VENNKLLVAFVGMPGSGKTEATAYLHNKGLPFVRFGDVTDKGLKEQGLSLTPENERAFREDIRARLGMAAYAMESIPAIEHALVNHEVLILDGLYSWAEYKILKEKFLGLRLVHVYAQPDVRYERLAKRPHRPLTAQEARVRDIAEIEKIDKGGPIAIADYVVVNNGHSLDELHEKVEQILTTIGIRI